MRRRVYTALLAQSRCCERRRSHTACQRVRLTHTLLVRPSPPLLSPHILPPTGALLPAGGCGRLLHARLQLAPIERLGSGGHDPGGARWRRPRGRARHECTTIAARGRRSAGPIHSIRCLGSLRHPSQFRIGRCSAQSNARRRDESAHWGWQHARRRATRRTCCARPRPACGSASSHSGRIGECLVRTGCRDAAAQSHHCRGGGDAKSSAALRAGQYAQHHHSQQQSKQVGCQQAAARQPLLLSEHRALAGGARCGGTVREVRARRQQCALQPASQETHARVVVGVQLRLGWVRQELHGPPGRRVARAARIPLIEQRVASFMIDVGNATPKQGDGGCAQVYGVCLCASALRRTQRAAGATAGTPVHSDFAVAGYAYACACSVRACVRPAIVGVCEPERRSHRVERVGMERHRTWRRADGGDASDRARGSGRRHQMAY